MSFNVDALRQWWDVNMSDATKPYWVLHRSAGGRPGPVIANYSSDNLDASFTTLVEMIQNNIAQGVNEFWVVCRPGGPNDTKGKIEYQLRSTGFQMAQNQGVGIAGMGSMYPGVYGFPQQIPAAAPPVDVEALRAQIAKEVEEKLAAKHALEVMQMKHEAQMEKMQEAIEGIAESRKSNFDRFLEVLENPDAAKGFIGMIQMVKGMINPQGMPSSAIGHVPSQKAPKVYEMPAEPDTEGESDDDEAEGPQIFEGLQGEYDCAIEAVNILHQAGWDAPGELLQKVAKFAIANPAMAQNLIANL